MRFIFLKRLIPSLKRRLRVFFGKRFFWARIQNNFFYLDIQDKLHRSFYYAKKYEEENFNYIKNHVFFKNKFTFIMLEQILEFILFLFLKYIKIVLTYILLSQFQKL